MKRTDTMAGANDERKVALRRETLRELSVADLRLVADVILRKRLGRTPAVQLTAVPGSAPMATTC